MGTQFLQIVSACHQIILIITDFSIVYAWLLEPNLYLATDFKQILTSVRHLPDGFSPSKLGKGPVRQFVHVPGRHLRVLQDVIERDILHRVIRTVDVRVMVAERGLEDERRRITIAVGRRVVGAGISADSLLVGDIGVLMKRTCFSTGASPNKV